MRSPRHQHLRPAVLQHAGEPLVRLGGIERHVGAAGLERRQDRHHQLQRALQGEAHQHLRPDAQIRAAAAPAGWLAGRARRRSARSSSQTTATASGACAACAAKQLVQAEPAPPGSAETAFQRPAAARAPPRSAAAARPVGIAGSSTAAVQQHLQMAQQSARSVERSKRSVAVLQIVRRADRLPSRRGSSVRSNLARPLRRSTGAKRQLLAAPGARAGAFWRTSIAWKSGVGQRRSIPGSGQLLDQLLERHVLVGEGLEHGRPHPAERAPRSDGLAGAGRRAAPGC